MSELRNNCDGALSYRAVTQGRQIEHFARRDVLRDEGPDVRVYIIWTRAAIFPEPHNFVIMGLYACTIDGRNTELAVLYFRAILLQLFYCIGFNILRIPWNTVTLPRV
jgi:hypothetical protein